VDYFAFFKTANNLENGVHFPNVSEKLVAQALAFVSAFHETGDIIEFHDSRHGFLGTAKFRKLLEAFIGNWNYADVRINSGEWIIRNIYFLFSDNFE